MTTPNPENMKKSDSVNNYISITANIGVLLGILLLAYELNQNNALLESQILYNHKESRLSGDYSAFQNERLADIWVKTLKNQVLTDTEQVMLNAWYYESFVSVEYEYQESMRGRLELPINGYRASFWNSPGMIEFWHLNSYRFEAGYVKFMNENVTNEQE